MLHQTVFLAALFFASAFSLQLLSNDLRQGGKLPVAHTCDSAVQAKSPELHWTAAPADTSVFVLILHNRDFLHWSVKLDKSTTSLTTGASKGLSKIATVYSDFVPPCPPSGVVGNYVFELFALAKDIEVPENLRTALHLLRHSEHTLATSQLSVYYGEYTKGNKRAVLADTTVNLGSNISIPVTTVTGPDTALFNAQVQTVTPPGAGKQIRVEVLFTASVTAGAGCFKAGLVGIQTPNTANLPKFCSTGTGVVNGRFATSLPAAATSFQAWIAANTNPTVGTTVTFSGVVSTTSYTIPTELPAPTVYNVTGDGLTVTAVYTVDDAATSYANLDLPAPPTVPSGKVLTHTVSVTLPATLCAMIGNGQIDDTKGTSVCDSTKPVTRTYTLPRGVAPSLAWVKFTKRTTKRGVLANQNVPVIQRFAVIDDPTLANIPTTTTTTSGCTDSWTLVNLRFGDMISR